MKKANFSKYLDKKIFPLLKAIFCTAVLTFFCYALLSQFIGAGKLDGYYSQFTANLLASLAATVLYALWFHWFYTSKSNKTYMLHAKTDTPFHWIIEGKAFFKENCTPFLMIYGVLIVLFEIIVTVTALLGTRMHWSLVYIYASLFPLRIADDRFNLFLAPVLSTPVLILLIVILALLSRKRIHKKLSQ